VKKIIRSISKEQGIEDQDKCPKEKMNDPSFPGG
jgi:hypothetical protein